MDDLEVAPDPRIAAVREVLSTLISEAHLDHAVRNVLDVLARTPPPANQLDRATLTAAREILHVHRFDVERGETGTPDSFYGGITYGTALLRRSGANSLAELHNGRERTMELEAVLTARWAVADEPPSDWIRHRLRHIINNPNLSFANGGLPL